MKSAIKLLLIVFLSSIFISGTKSPSITVTWNQLDQYDTLIINGRIYAALGNEYFHPRDNICMSYPKLGEDRVRDELDKSSWVQAATAVDAARKGVASSSNAVPSGSDPRI